MAGYYGRKKTFKEKMADFKGKLKRAFFLSATAGAVIGGPAYYHYGTIQEQEVRIKEVKSEWVEYDSKKGEAVYEYKLVTDKGQVFANKNTKLHLKFNSKDIQDQLSEGRNSYYSYYEDEETKKQREANDPKNKVYRIKYYGARIDIPFIHTYPNVLSVQEVTKEELAARAKAQAEARRNQQQGQQGQQGQQPQAGQPQQQNGQPQQVAPSGALSGTMITFETVVDGQKIQMTVPIEAANKITVNKVTPLVPPAPPAPRGPG